MAEYISAQAKIGIGIETSAAWGTGVIPYDIGVLLPVSPFSISEPTDVIIDTALRGGVYRDWGSYQGPVRIEGTLEGNLHLKEFCYLLAAFYGGTQGAGKEIVQQALDGTSFAYQFAKPNAQSRGLTIQVDDPLTPSPTAGADAGNNPRRYVGCKISSLELRIAAGEAAAVTYSAGFTGKALYRKADGAAFGSDNAAPKSVPADASEKPLLGWSAFAGLGGTGNITISAGGVIPNVDALTDLGTQFFKLTECTITMERELQVVYAEQNQTIPSAIIAGPLGITLSATIHFDDWANMEKYRAKTQGNFFILLTYGAAPPAAANRSLYLRFPKMDLAEAAAEIDFGGVTPMLSYSGRALYDGADPFPCLVEIAAVHDSSVTYLA